MLKLPLKKKVYFNTSVWATRKDKSKISKTLHCLGVFMGSFKQFK